MKSKQRTHYISCWKDYQQTTPTKQHRQNWMKEISVRRIKEPDFSEGFSIRNIGTLLSERDLVQELHRHNFFSLFPVFALTQIEKAGVYRMWAQFKNRWKSAYSRFYR